MRRLVLLFLAVLPGCLSDPTIDEVFCDPGEPCFASQNDPHTGVFCGGAECPYDPCVKGWMCGGTFGNCTPTGLPPDANDNNFCTVDECVDGQWTHTKLTPAQLDDGDPCTVDQCDETSGPIHTNTCT